MNLHIIHKSASQHTAAIDALPLIAGDDCVMFIDDGIYNGIEGNLYVAQFIRAAKQCYAIEAHALTRGIDNLDKHINAISMDEFVTLSLTAKHNISWY